MNTDIKNFTINVTAGLFTAIVFLYLDKNGFTSLAYVVFGFYVLLLVLTAFTVFRSQKIIKTQTDKNPNTIKETGDKKNPEDQLNRSKLPWKFNEKISLGINAYHDVLTKNGEKFFRITLKDISRKNMPPPYESDHIPEEILADVATVSFSHGFMFTHGSRVKKVETSPIFDDYHFDMSKIENDEEGRYSVFFFKTENVSDGEYFFRCFVDHINPTKKEVELSLYFIWTNDSNKKGPEGRLETRP